MSRKWDRIPVEDDGEAEDERIPDEDEQIRDEDEQIRDEDIANSFRCRNIQGRMMKMMINKQNSKPRRILITSVISCVSCVISCFPPIKQDTLDWRDTLDR